ncbi:hypothetical protein FRB95_000330 [Tulasnella sp. JGI-2019a]|nr:hypothetical protein FRB95_000330 [Tulasnella sp. JGI-2019a]
MEIPLTRLIGFCVSLALSVLYTGLFSCALYTLMGRKKTSEISPVITVALIVMFLLNAGQLCLQATDIYMAFFGWKGPNGPTCYFLDYGSRILPARDCIFWIEGLLTDVVVCWRLYVIWLRRKCVMIIPIALLLGGLVSGIIMLIFTIRRTINGDNSLYPVIDRWWEITLGFTIAVNIVVPGMIVGRLWYIARKLGLIGSNSVKPYRQIALALMESGTLYTVGVTAWLVFFLSGSLPGLYLGACILPTVVAIVPTLIVLRINTFTQSHEIPRVLGEYHSPALDVGRNINSGSIPAESVQCDMQTSPHSRNRDHQVDSYYARSSSSLFIEPMASSCVLPTTMKRASTTESMKLGAIRRAPTL